jgi:hypothetical protein
MKFKNYEQLKNKFTKKTQKKQKMKKTNSDNYCKLMVNYF